MPSSRYNAIPTVLDIVMAIKPKKILDIGIGYGKYGVLFREYLEVWNTENPYNEKTTKIIGVEAFAEYENTTWRVYDKVIIGDVRELIQKELYGICFDLVFMGDVIEHFTKEEGQKLLSDLLRKHIIIVTPFIVNKQDAVYNNPFEVHRSEWKIEDLPGFKRRLVGNQQIFYK